jgi:hypothetical protein
MQEPVSPEPAFFFVVLAPVATQVRELRQELSARIAVGRVGEQSGFLGVPQSSAEKLGYGGLIGARVGLGRHPYLRRTRD